MRRYALDAVVAVLAMAALLLGLHLYIDHQAFHASAHKHAAPEPPK